jgi:hypothetical protein
VTAVCAWCKAPREPGDTCPGCGANYAKADAIRAQGRAGAAARAPAPAEPGREAEERPRLEDPALEWKLCVAALPAMLLAALAFHAFPMGHFLQRTFLGMPVHELGHAVAAWFCGYAAMPTLWKTLTAESRGFVMPLLLAGAIGFLAYRAWIAEHRGLLALAGALFLLQLAGTLFASPRTAQMLIVFGGDGLGMVLGVALMATFFVGKGTQLYRGGLRWGFLAIGAAAYVDMAAVWWRARRDHGAIPFGEMEGSGLSDATRLVDEFGWTTEQLTGRYLALAAACFLALCAVYAWGVWRARHDLESARGRVPLSA